MPDRATWFWTVAAIVIWSIIVAEEAYPAELRIVTTKRTGTWQMASNNECVSAAQRIRVKLVKPARFFCDGRRV